MFWLRLSNAALLVLMAGLGGASILLGAASPGGSTLLGSAPSIWTPGGARAPEREYLLTHSPHFLTNMPVTHPAPREAQ